MAEVEQIVLRHVDEDDGVSILQDLMAEGFVIVHLPSFEAETDRIATEVANRIMVIADQLRMAVR